MPALNFKARFAAPVESGQKRCTIRAERRYPIKFGDRLYLYTGMRTKQCRKLGEAICVEASDLYISDGRRVTVGNVRLDMLEEIALSRADGFDRLRDFIQFFQETYGLPFEGQLIKW